MGKGIGIGIGTALGNRATELLPALGMPVGGNAGQTPTLAPAEAPAPSEPTAAPPQPQPADGQDPIQRVVNQIQAMEPPAAAALLLSHAERDANAKELISALMNTVPPDGLANFLDVAVARYPVLRPVLELYQARRDWFGSVVSELRRHSQPPPPGLGI